MSFETPPWAGTLAERGQRVLVDAYARYPIELVSGEGCRVVDATGTWRLDFAAGIAVSSLGHGHPALVEAIRKAAGGLLHVSNLYWTEPMIRLAERLVAASGLERVFFCNSGAEAIEGSIKIARKARPGRPKLVVFEGSFHGRSLGALSATAQDKYQAPFRPLVPGFEVVPFGDPAALDAALTDEVCAVLIEPVQGEGGIRPAPDGFLAALRERCDARGALLILDEIQCGAGRTGRFLAFQHAGILPDLVACAKGLAGGVPIGAILARGDAGTALEHGEHGSTFGGGPFASRVALAVLEQVLAPGFLEGVTARGGRLAAGLRRLADQHGRHVAGSRGVGLMQGLVLHRPQAGLLVERLHAEGLLAVPAGKNVVRLVPPLVVSDQEIDEALDLIGRALSGFEPPETH